MIPSFEIPSKSMSFYWCAGPNEFFPLARTWENVRIGNRYLQETIPLSGIREEVPLYDNIRR